MTRVLVTGANGQLGKSIQKIAPNYSEMEVDFKSFEELDVTDVTNIAEVFAAGGYEYCINCAAYTNVEKAESEPKKAYAVNAEGVKKLSTACHEHGVTLIYISTDYVFDGEKAAPYTIQDEPNPINVYGASKLEGEDYIHEILKSYFIIRTSWLYSEFGKNFYKTILQKAKSGEVLRVTDEQTGCPTHAGNLAKYILELVHTRSVDYGLHHFTDGEAMTWYGFAEKILRDKNLLKTVSIIKVDDYFTVARRPVYSVLKVSIQNSDKF